MAKPSAGEDVVGIDFNHMTIEIIPAPMTLMGLAPLGLIATRRRRS